ncbi:MAG: hypothetical protein ABIH20_01440 [Candidatus Diapherotrites archaeon]
MIESTKGQIFSVDMILAAIVFLFIITSTIVFSNEINNNVILAEKDNLRKETAITAASALVYSSGSPANWENLADLNNVSSIGIAKTRNFLDSEKVSKLVDLNQTNYSAVKYLLGVSKYGLKISVLNLQDKSVLAEFGLEPESDDSVSAVNRFAYYNGQDVLIRVKVFE